MQNEIGRSGGGGGGAGCSKSVLGGVIWDGATLIRRRRLISLKHLVFQNNLAYKRVNDSQRPQSQV